MTEYNKDNPFSTKIIKRHILTNEGSTKRTYHITLDLGHLAISYKPGDSIAIFPENNQEDVQALLKALNLRGDEKITDPRSKAIYTISYFLKTKANLIRIPPSLLKLTDNPLLLGSKNKKARAQFINTYHLIEFFQMYPLNLPLQELISYFFYLVPRFYSIASSPKVSPRSVDLLVASVTYKHGQKKRQGLGSYFLCQLAQIHETPIYAYLHPTSHFILPKNGTTPIIMIGSGTGVAPYRAFLQQRKTEEAKGLNWLIFGERNKKTDYYYQSFFESLEKKNFLRLDLAFSRDQKEKLYVQHILLKQGKLIWETLQNNAHIYICGDALHMAKDVMNALHMIIETYGKTDTKRYIKELKSSKKLLLDVY